MELCSLGGWNRPEDSPLDSPERSVGLRTPGLQPVSRVGLWLVEPWVMDLSCVSCQICAHSLWQL